MNYFPQKLNNNIEFDRSFDGFDLKQYKGIIQVKRNGYEFQISSNPFSSVKYKGKKKQIVGYKYSLGMHMIAGHGNIDACEKIKVGEKVAWAHSNVLKDSHTTIVTSYCLSPGVIYGQTFTTTSSYTLNSISLMVWRNWNAYPGTIYVSLRATDVLGMPTGPDLINGSFDGDTIIEQPASLSLAEWKEVEFDAPIILDDATKYAFIFSVLPYPTVGYGGCNFNADSVGTNYPGGTAVTSLDGGVTWAEEISVNDILFKCYKKDGSAPNSTITISNNDLFGGDKSEGGIIGNVDLMFGAADQMQNSYLTARLDTDIPAFRGLWGAVLNQVYIGTSPYLKPWSFLLKRVSKQISGEVQWYKEKAVLRPREVAGDDLNAAHIIRECLIDKEWGLGFDATEDIDDNAWKEAANILYEEGFGLSIQWDQVIPVEDFIDDILNHIAGILYQDLATGKWILTLTRDNNFSIAYDSYITGDNSQATITPTQNKQYAQTFTTSRTYQPAYCKIKIFKALIGQTVNAKCEIQRVDINGKPNGAIISEGNIQTANIGTSAAWVVCNFTKTGILNVNTQYALVIYPNTGVGTLNWRVNTYGSFSGGSYIVTNDDAVTWTKVSGSDFMFEIYAGANLETFNEDDIMDLDEFTRSAYGEIVDQVTVQFWDKLAHKSRSCEARDIALMEKQGGAVIEKILNYQGICDPTLANNVAERELKLVTSMLAGMRLKCTRKMSHLKPNNTFKISWSDLGIVEMVIRVLNANYGSLDKNEVYLTCVEDTFSAAETIYGDAPDTLWTDSINDPIDIINRRLIEIPYWSLCNHVVGSPSLVDALDDDTCFICTIAGKPTEDAFDYDILARLSALYDFEDVGVGNNSFTPIGVLTNAILRNAIDTTIDLSSQSDLDSVDINTYAIINEEIVKVISTDLINNQVTMARGVLDTVPAIHLSGDIIYFMELSYGEIGTEYTNGNTPSTKLLSRTARGSLAESDATIETKSPALNSRMIRPYPPGNLKFNGDSYPSYFSSGAHGNKVTISWNHRDRTNPIQLNSLVEHSDSGISLEFGASYTIKLYDANNVLRQTITGLTGTSYELTEANEITWCGSLQESLRFVIYTVRDGYNSLNNGYDITIERSFRGNVSAASAITGSMSIFMNGVVSSVSNISSTNLNRISLLIGLTGSILETQSDLYTHYICVGTTHGISSISGSLMTIVAIIGSTGAICGIDSVLDVHEGFPAMAGSVIGVLNIIGDLSVKPVLQDHCNSLDGGTLSGVMSLSTTLYEGQHFTADATYTCTIAKVVLSKNDTLAGETIIVEIYEASEGLPTGIPLCSGAVPSEAILGIGNAYKAWQEVDLGSGCEIISGQDYCVVSHSSVAGFNMWFHAGDIVADGTRVWSSDAGSNWNITSGWDHLFETWGE